jgi:hypothetical protein
MFARNVNGLLSALLSLKLQPSVIRYAGASRVAKAVAAECASQIAADGIFHFASGKRGKHQGRKRVRHSQLQKARFPLVPADLWTSVALEAWILSLERSRAEHPRRSDVESPFS